MNKIIDAVMIVISLIVLGGSIYAISILVQAGDAISQLDATEIPEVSGIGATTIQPAVDLIKAMIFFGWIWSVTALLTSLYAIYAAIMRIRAPAGKK